MVTSRHILQPEEKLLFITRLVFNLHSRSWGNFLFVLKLKQTFEICWGFILRIKYYEIVIYRKFVHLKQSFWFLNFLLGFLLFSQREAPGDKLTDNE